MPSEKAQICYCLYDATIIFHVPSEGARFTENHALELYTDVYISVNPTQCTGGGWKLFVEKANGYEGRCRHNSRMVSNKNAGYHRG